MHIYIYYKTIHMYIYISWYLSVRMDLMIVMSIGRSPDRGSMPIDRYVYIERSGN